MNLGASFATNLIGGRRRKRSRATSPSSALNWQDSLLPKTQIPAQTSAPKRFLRLLPFALGSILTLVILTARAFSLQIAHGRENYLLSESNRVVTQKISAERGAIFDRNGEVVARNQPGFSVFWTLEEGANGRPQDLNPNLLGSLAKLLDLDTNELSAKILEAETQGKTRVLLKRGLSRDDALKLEVSRNSFPNIVTEVSPIREYPNGEIWAHVLGFVGEASNDDLLRWEGRVEPGDTVGKTNLEFFFENYLAGTPGERLLETDAFGHEFRELKKVPSKPGKSLVLTLDAKLQQDVSAALAEGVKKSRAVGGAAVVQNVKSGAILALASWPSFDANLFARGISQKDFEKLTHDPQKPLFNRVVSGAFPPGSTYKPFVATAALEEKVITPITTIDDQGSITVGGRVFHGWAPGGLGVVNLKTAIAKSSDIYFYTVGGGYGNQRGVGAEKIAKWARRFGFDAQTGVNLSAEASGLIPDPAWKLGERGEAWYRGETFNVSIGQGDVLVTPLQLNNAMAAIANGGTLYRPRLVHSILDLDGHVYKELQSEVLRPSVAPASTLDAVKEGLRAVCQPGGTAYPFFDFPIAVAGKTGTSETGKKNRTHAWFTAFAPYDKPEIAVTVFLEEGGEGSHNAAPVARRIMEAYFRE
jgi:penicillin-binding protein 2